MNKLIEFFRRGSNPDFDRKLEKITLRFDKYKDSDLAIYREVLLKATEIIDTLKLWLVSPRMDTDYSLNLNEMAHSIDEILKLLKKTRLLQTDQLYIYTGELRNIRRQFLLFGAGASVNFGSSQDPDQLLPNYSQTTEGYDYRYHNRMKDEYIANLSRYAGILERIRAAVNVNFYQE